MKSGILIDIGGTHIRFGICGISKEQPDIIIDTPSCRDGIVQEIGRIIRQIRREQHDIMNNLVVSCPGMVTKDGIVTKALYLDINGLNLKRELENIVNMQVVVENDANLQAFGRHKKSENLLYLVIGTAVGGAFVDETGIFRGANGYACEFGHVYIGGEKKCYCGRKGCLDTVISGKKMISLWGDEWWKRSDKQMIEYIIYCGQCTENAIETLSLIFDPDEIVVCGHICNNHYFTETIVSLWEKSSWFNSSISFENNTWKNVYQAACKLTIDKQ